MGDLKMKAIIFLVGLIILSGCASIKTNLSGYDDYPPTIKDQNSITENKLMCIKEFQEFAKRHAKKFTNEKPVTVTCDGQRCVCE